MIRDSKSKPFPDDFDKSNRGSGHGDQDQVVKLDLWADCILPTTNDAMRELILPVIIGNVVLKLVYWIVSLCLRNSWTLRVVNKYIVKDICELPTIVIGVGLLGYHFRGSFIMFKIICVASGLGALMIVHAKKFGYSPLKTVWIYTFFSILMNEIGIIEQRLLSKSVINTSLRPHIMLMSMKLISIADDINKKMKKSEEITPKPVPSKKKRSSGHESDTATDSEGDEPITDPLMPIFVSILAYLFHPASVLLGCWHPVFNYSMNASQPRRSRLKPTFQTIGNIVFAMVSLSLSNCLIQFIAVNFIEDVVIFPIYDYLPNEVCVIIHKIIIAYFVALQFRTSHYFISKLTQAFFVFWGHE